MNKLSEKLYTADSVKVLRGLEPVKARPGMYTRTDSPTHIIQEVLDNAADEALAGYANAIDVTFYLDDSIEVSDNGRGIPIEIPSGEKSSALSLIFTQLHSGSKFDKTDSDSAYQFSGGLHGVGVSVTNALSSKLIVTTCRDKTAYQLTFLNGNQSGNINNLGKTKSAGTTVRSWPNPIYFDHPSANINDIAFLAKSKAVLMPGVTFTLKRELEGNQFEETVWCYPDGMLGYIAERDQQIAESQPQEDGEINVVAPLQQSLYAENKEGIQCAIQFRKNAGGRGESYVNLIPTIAGGTHEAGFRIGIFESFKLFCDAQGLMPRSVKLAAEDCWINCHYILSAKLLDPQFQGQTKEKLTNKDAYKLIASLTESIVTEWLNHNAQAAKTIAGWIISSALSRTKSSIKIEKRKTSSLTLLPAKLADCEVSGADAEIFFVEGDSAGGSAKLARNKSNQAILALKGKITNVWNYETNTIYSQQEIQDIFQAIGIEPHANAAEADLSNLRYGKICILSDADIDGEHIKVLVLGLFLKHAPAIIEKGHLYISQPPLFRIDIDAHAGKPIKKQYVSNDQEKASLLNQLAKQGVPEHKIHVQRFKGLGEMMPSQLSETTLNPDTRTLIQVNMNPNDKQAIQDMFNLLLDKGEPRERRLWMEEKGYLAEVDV